MRYKIGFQSKEDNGDWQPGHAEAEGDDHNDALTVWAAANGLHPPPDFHGEWEECGRRWVIDSITTVARAAFDRQRFASSKPIAFRHPEQRKGEILWTNIQPTKIQEDGPPAVLLPRTGSVSYARCGDEMTQTAGLVPIFVNIDAFERETGKPIDAVARMAYGGLVEVLYERD
jgi:hypothetical protein